MKKELLIKKLQELPDGVEVCIFNFKLNANEDSGDGSSVGIYPNFDVEYLPKEDVAEDSEPFAVLAFVDDLIDNE